MLQTLAYYATYFYKDFSTYTTEELQKLGLNFGSLFFIVYVGKHPDCTPSELTHALDLDWGHSQRSVTKLVNSGFLTKEKSNENARTYHLHLTELGEKAFAVSHQVFYDWDKDMLGALSTEEQSQLFSLLQKVGRKKEGEHHV